MLNSHYIRIVVFGIIRSDNLCTGSNEPEYRLCAAGAAADTFMLLNIQNDGISLT